MSILGGRNLKEICILMKMQKRVKEFDGDFKVENSKLVCVYCNEKLDYRYKQLLEKHVSSKTHLRKQRMLRAKLVRVIEDHESDPEGSINDSVDFDDEWESNKTEKKNKKKLTQQEKIQIRLKEFGSVLKQQGDELLCTYCNQKLKYNQNLSIKRHLASKFHENKVSQKNFLEQGGERPARQKKTTATAAQVEFNIELCKVFLVSGISISKLSHPIVKNFFAKYTTMMIPVESTLRKSYMEPARLTLKAEAERLKHEMLNRMNKNGAKGSKSKKKKRDSDDEEEDPLVFTEEQLESMLSLKVEPKEEPMEETERLAQEMLNKNKKSGAKGRMSKKRKQSEASDDEEDPLSFREEQLVSMLSLKDEPTEEQIQEADRLEQETLNKNKKSGVKGRKSKKRKRSKVRDDEEDPLGFTEEQLESMLSLKVEPKEVPSQEADRLEQDILNKNKKSGAKGRNLKERKRSETGDEEEDPLGFTEEQLESMLSLKVESKEEPREELMEDSVQDPLLVPRGELEDSLELKDEPIELKVELKEEPRY